MTSWELAEDEARHSIVRPPDLRVGPERETGRRDGREYGRQTEALRRESGRWAEEVVLGIDRLIVPANFA